LAVISQTKSTGELLWLAKQWAGFRIILFLTADGDALATSAFTEPMAKLFGVTHKMVGRDWSLPSFGHMLILIIERGTLDIGPWISAWLDSAARRQ
jgi:hypothetical protein